MSKHGNIVVHAQIYLWVLIKKKLNLMSISIQHVLVCQAVDLHKPSQIMSCILVIAENQMGSLSHNNSMSFTHNRKNKKLITT
jgi:hypothetical protein